VKTIFALKPFCIIAQRWARADTHGEPARILDTNLLVFYTFETFIQESLAFAARRRSISADTVIAAYEHVYSNTWPPDICAACRCHTYVQHDAQHGLARRGRTGRK